MMHVLHFGTKEQQARKDAETTFTADTRDFMEGLEGEILVNFKREWGVVPTEQYLKAISVGQVAAIDIDATLYNLERISEEIMIANRVAANMYTHTRDLSQEDKGYLLVCLFLADLIGRRSLEGMLFTQKIQEQMYQQELPSMAHKYTLCAYIIVINMFMLLWTLYVAGYDSNKFFNSFFYITFICVLGQDVMIDVLMKSIYDFFIPNIIYDSVSYAKHLCDNHIDNLVSASIPHSVFEGYSASRYLHASHFYADTLEFSVE